MSGARKTTTGKDQGRTRTVDIPGIGSVLLERSKRAKLLNISVKPFRGVRVAVPHGVSFAAGERFARTKLDWLRLHVERVRRLESACQSAPKITISREKAARVLSSRLDVLARKHGYSYNRVSIRNQKTRWGSCSAANNISLNMKLLLLPEELRDYVLLHELVHTRVKHHGKRFWEELLRHEPRAKLLYAELRRYDARLLDEMMRRGTG